MTHDLPPNTLLPTREQLWTATRSMQDRLRRIRDILDGKDDLSPVAAIVAIRKVIDE